MICGGCGGPLFKRECLGYCNSSKRWLPRLAPTLERALVRRQAVVLEWVAKYENERGEPLRVAIWRAEKRAA